MASINLRGFSLYIHASTIIYVLERGLVGHSELLRQWLLSIEATLNTIAIIHLCITWYMKIMHSQDSSKKIVIVEVLYATVHYTAFFFYKPTDTWVFTYCKISMQNPAYGFNATVRWQHKDNINYSLKCTLHAHLLFWRKFWSQYQWTEMKYFYGNMYVSTQDHLLTE